MTRATSSADLTVGQRVRLGEDRRTWRVQAVSEHFAALVQQAQFQKKGVYCYTVLDWRQGVRGPCNLIGQGFGDGSYSEAECSRMLEGFEYDRETDPARLEAIARGETSWPLRSLDLEVSHRNRVTLEAVEVLP